MSELIDRHELRLNLEAEERTARRLLGKRHDPLVTSFFELIYRALNKTPTVKETP